MKMRALLATTCLSLGAVAIGSAASAQDCGSVVIASMNWQSTEVLSNVDRIILSEGYGCDTVPTITSMAEKGQPDIAPEAWVDMLPDMVKKGVEEGKLIQAANVLPDGGVNGWWIPNTWPTPIPTSSRCRTR
jgi:glycine betaine/proline transport system substrate-binding protein